MKEVRTGLWAAADLIIDLPDGIVLIKRGHSPWKGMWALPGGGLRIGKETIEQAAKRELKEETGLSVSLKNLELLEVRSNPNRDPRGHVLSHVFLVKDPKGKLHEGSDAKQIKIVKKIPKRLASDHREMIMNYLKKK